jgi:uncharacterized DUF497 family protein
VRYVWDEQKAHSNLRKHGVAFEDAVREFLDPLVVIEFDDFVYGEDRWLATGFSGAFNLLVVVHTMRSNEQGTEVTRIISARPATSHERRRYDAR